MITVGAEGDAEGHVCKYVVLVDVERDLRSGGEKVRRKSANAGDMGTDG